MSIKVTAPWNWKAHQLFCWSRHPRGHLERAVSHSVLHIIQRKYESLGHASRRVHQYLAAIKDWICYAIKETRAEVRAAGNQCPWGRADNENARGESEEALLDDPCFLSMDLLEPIPLIFHFWKSSLLLSAPCEGFEPDHTSLWKEQWECFHSSRSWWSRTLVGI